MSSYDNWLEKPFQDAEKSEKKSFESLADDLMQPGSRFDPKNLKNIIEALSKICAEDIDLLEDYAQKNQYEQFGRFIISNAYEVMEVLAEESIYQGE